MILSLKTKNGENNIDEKWKNIKDSLTSAVAKTLGYGVKEKWIKSDTWILISERKKIRSNNFHCKDNTEMEYLLNLYRNRNREVNRNARRGRRKRIVKPRKHPGLEISRNSIKSPN